MAEGHGWECWSRSGSLAHPDSPAGGSGPGFSRPPAPERYIGSLSSVPHPDSPAARVFCWHAEPPSLPPPGFQPTRVAKELPKGTELGKAPFDEPLTESERGLTREQLRQKHILEQQAELQSQAEGVTARERETGRGMQERGKAGAGLKAKPKHHVLPQQYKNWFEEHGFTGEWHIDKFTVELEESEHQAIHGGGNYRIGRTTGFEWNIRVMNELRSEEAKLGGRLLTRDEVFRVVERLMRQYKIPRRYVPY